MQASKILKTTSIAIAAIFILLTMAPAATAKLDTDAAMIPMPGTQTKFEHYVAKVAGYCLNGAWYEVWSAHYSTSVGYYDNDGDWNEDANTGHYTRYVNRYMSSSCSDTSVLNLADLTSESDAKYDAAMAPRYSARTTFEHYIAKVAGYCLNGAWYEVWSAHYSTSVGYYDNDNDWNEDYNTGHYTNYNNRRMSSNCNSAGAGNLADILMPATL